MVLSPLAEGEPMAANSQVRLTDGQLITLSATRELPTKWSGHVTFKPRYGGGEILGVSLAPSENATAALNSIRASVRYKQSFRGGETVIADGVNPRTGEAITAAGWVGPWNTAFGFFYGEESQTERIMTNLARLNTTDTPDGLMIEVPGFDVLSLQSTIVTDKSRVIAFARSAAERLIPDWEGARTRAGEVWHAERTEEGEHLECLVVASESAVATVYALASGSLDGSLSLVNDWVEFSCVAAR